MAVASSMHQQRLGLVKEKRDKQINNKTNEQT